jgi:hypothetical protein
MRKEFSKALRTFFERAMKEQLPEYKPVKVKSVYLGPGERAYCWSPGGPVHCYIILVPSPKDTDEFTIELAWSVHGRFPELGMRPSGLPSADLSEFRQEEFACRLGNLWTKEDIWWRLSNAAPFEEALSFEALVARSKPVAAGEAEAAVEPQVRDAMEKLRTHGVTYLARFARARIGPAP